MNTKSISAVFLSLFMLVGCSESETPEGDGKEDNIQRVTLQGKRGDHVHHYIAGELQPFMNSPLTLPSSYSGPTFDLRHDYPSSVPSNIPQPWKAVTAGDSLTPEKSMEYVEALKAHVGPDMRKLLYSYDSWKSQEEAWWQSIWLGTQREPIHGMYVGSEYNAGTLTSDQTTNLTTFVLTMYDATAAVTLGNIWGTDIEGAKSPKLSDVTKTQYAEGSVIVKFAFVTAPPEEFSPMEGTATWPVYSNINPATGKVFGYVSKDSLNPAEMDTTMQTLYMMQCDILVKDSDAAPETGWVFSTLVYKHDAPGNDAWDRMVPLGATWGGNSNVKNLSPDALNAPVTVDLALTQNWINLMTPNYARSTLGWAGRLSGPNDGAVLDDVTTKEGTKYDALASVGCLGCHSTAQYEAKHLLVPINLATGNVYTPGETEWMRYFQSRAGDVSMDSGQIALDYDMVTSFKAIPLWEEAMKNAVIQDKVKE